MTQELREIGQASQEGKMFNNFVGDSLNTSANNQIEESKQPPRPKPSHQNQLSVDGIQNARGRNAQ